MRFLTSSLESSQCRGLILLKTELETWERSAFISEAFWLHVKVWVYIYISFFSKTTDLRLVHLLVAAEWFCRIVKKKFLLAYQKIFHCLLHEGFELIHMKFWLIIIVWWNISLQGAVSSTMILLPSTGKEEGSLTGSMRMEMVKILHYSRVQS